MNIKVLGIDLGKRYFHVHAVDAEDHLITRKKLRRKELLSFLSNLESSLIGMEAYGEVMPTISRVKRLSLVIHRS